MSRISTPFGATSTAAEVAAGIDLTGRSAVVTGAASGIGVETARALAGTGAAVTLAVRDLTADRALRLLDRLLQQRIRQDGDEHPAVTDLRQEIARLRTEHPTTR